MIPDPNKAQVDAAIQTIRSEGVPASRHSTRYCLVDDHGQHFPPKYVISLACRSPQHPEGLPSHEFVGGNPTNSVLTGLGFQVVACSCGGRHPSASREGAADD